MIPEKAFYFVRHGQTDHNVSHSNLKEDHPFDIPLNQVGRDQAKVIEPLIASLPLQAVCVSPTKRTLETKEIITPRLKVEHCEIADLGECSANTWHELFRCGMYSPLPVDGEAFMFIQRVRRGLIDALSLPGTPLIVAHGGVHWAIAALLGLRDHSWAIDNCIPVHFFKNEEGGWQAKKLKL